MIALGVVKEVERLLKQERLSQRAIARLLKVSRGTVCSIASGRRVESRSDSQTVGAKALLGRCRHCGGRVFLPCLLCQVRMLEVRRKAEGFQTIKQAYRNVELDCLPIEMSAPSFESDSGPATPSLLDFEERHPFAFCDQEGSEDEGTGKENGLGDVLAKASKSWESSCSRVALPTTIGLRLSLGSVILRQSVST